MLQFGEGLYQAVYVKKRLGRDTETVGLAHLAVEMIPDNSAYRALPKQCGPV